MIFRCNKICNNEILFYFLRNCSQNSPFEGERTLALKHTARETERAQLHVTTLFAMSYNERKTFIVVTCITDNKTFSGTNEKEGEGEKRNIADPLNSGNFYLHEASSLSAMTIIPIDKHRHRTRTTYFARRLSSFDIEKTIKQCDVILDGWGRGRG